METVMPSRITIRFERTPRTLLFGLENRLLNSRERNLAIHDLATKFNEMTEGEHLRLLNYLMLHGTVAQKKKIAACVLSLFGPDHYNTHPDFNEVKLW